MPPSPVRGVAAATGLLILISLAGCSSGSDTTTPPNSSAGTTTSTPASTTTGPSSSSSSSSATTTAVPTTAASTSSVPTTAIKDECTSDALDVTLNSGGAAAGTDYYSLTFTNRSSATCSMQGFPGVSFVDAAGTQAGGAAKREGTGSVTLVPLGPGASAHAVLLFHNAGLYESSCGTKVAASTLRTYPPDSTTAIDLPFAADICSNDVGQLSVEPVSAGATGPTGQ